MNVILDMIGGDFTEKNLRCLGEYGRLVQIAFLKGQFPKVDLMQIMKQRLVITGSTLALEAIKKKRIADQLKKISGQRLKVEISNHASIKSISYQRLMKRTNLWKTPCIWGRSL